MKSLGIDIGSSSVKVSLMDIETGACVASTNPDFDAAARAMLQIKNALDATIELGGQCYVFWGGREGYMSLLNTDMKREKEHMATMLRMARDYARSKGFKGTFLVEPKPMEPMKHQYDADTETVIGFLRAHGLDKDFMVNIEVNHATLAGHTFEHELQCAVDAGMLGSIDANRGDYQNGWDTDQFPIDLYEMVQAMMVILRGGGLKAGGTNFDAKTRRNSTDLEDIFIAHISAMDVMPRAAHRRRHPRQLALREDAPGALRLLRFGRRQALRGGPPDARAGCRVRPHA